MNKENEKMSPGKAFLQSMAKLLIIIIPCDMILWQIDPGIFVGVTAPSIAVLAAVIAVMTNPYKGD